MMVTRENLYTVEEFLAFTQLPEHADQRFELFDGVIEEMPPSNPQNSHLAGLIITLLNNFVLPHNLGFVTVPDGGYQVAPNKMYQPDVAYISRQRLPSLKNIGNVIPMAPDLAVEVVSPSESSRKVTRKAQGYLRGGTKLVWAVYPDEKEIDVYQLTADGEVSIKTIGADGELDGIPALPGLKIALKAIFAAAE
ncbi:MAG: Uma2 family endonuclease [Anaerolineae bacterium]|nr:Uma2 family endonuclease [Anaerolineae bacterium]